MSKQWAALKENATEDLIRKREKFADAKEALLSPRKAKK
jgi:hypothetical protein